MSCCDNQSLMPVETAIDTLIEQTHTISQTEIVSLEKAMHRITATDIHSPINVPPFANSAMDGYALRIEDLQQNKALPLVGKSMAGLPFNAELPENSCIRIMTGAVVPKGANAVVMQEKTQDIDGLIHFQSQPKEQENIRPIADDVKQGELVLTKGKWLTLREISLLASLGIKEVQVVRKPKVAFFSTGDELKQIGETLSEGEIYDSNRYCIKNWLEQMNCQIIDLGVIPDDKNQIRNAFLTASQQADLVISSGGVSVGDADFTKEVLEEEGQIGFWKIAIKPGKPFAFGTINQSLFCGLPGNPVSVLVTLHVLVQPLLAKLSGHSQWQASTKLPAIAESSFRKQPGRMDYQRAVYSINNQGTLIVSSINNQGSGAFSSLSKANCFAVIEKDRGNIEVGEIVQIELFNSALN